MFISHLQQQTLIHSLSLSSNVTCLGKLQWLLRPSNAKVSPSTFFILFLKTFTTFALFVVQLGCLPSSSSWALWEWEPSLRLVQLVSLVPTWSRAEAQNVFVEWMAFLTNKQTVQFCGQAFILGTCLDSFKTLAQFFRSLSSPSRSGQIRPCLGFPSWQSGLSPYF